MRFQSRDLNPRRYGAKQHDSWETAVKDRGVVVGVMYFRLCVVLSMPYGKKT
jgi:hypothetical protein